MARFLVQVMLLLIVTVYAFARGGWPEKASVSVFVTMLVLDQAFHLVIGFPVSELLVRRWHFALDAAGLILILAIALRADRIWTLWLASTQILAVIGHLLKPLDTTIFLRIEAIAIRVPTWMAICLIAIGTYLHAQRENAIEETSNQ